MNTLLIDIFKKNNIIEEHYDMYYKFLKIWIGLQIIVSFEEFSKYVNDIPPSRYVDVCKKINIENCTENDNCNIYSHKRSGEKECMPKEYIKSFIVGEFIKNRIDNELYEIKYIGVNAYRDPQLSTRIIFLSKDNIGIVILPFAKVEILEEDDYGFWEDFEDVTNFLKEFEFKLLCGYSYGGYLAQLIAFKMEDLNNVFILTSGVYPWLSSEIRDNFLLKMKGKLLNFGIKIDNKVDYMLNYPHSLKDYEFKENFNYVIPDIIMLEKSVENKLSWSNVKNFNIETEYDVKLHIWITYKEYLTLFLLKEKPDGLSKRRKKLIKKYSKKIKRKSRRKSKKRSKR